MRIFIAFVIFAALASAQAAETTKDTSKTVKWYFNSEEITKVVELYSKASGQKFIVDQGVRGRTSVFIQEPISIEEAFNHLSSALAINGFAISKQGDTMIIQSARNIQRSLNEISSTRPALKPERIVTWIISPKFLSVGKLNRDLRILPSKDGEMSIYPDRNQIILTDWSSNINRVADILEHLDKPLDPALVKMATLARKDQDTNMKEYEKRRAQERGEKPPPPPPEAPAKVGN